MKPVILYFSIAMLLGISAMGQESNQKPIANAKSKDHQTLCIRGFDSTGNLTKELTSQEVDAFYQHILGDTSIVQLRHDFEHPSKELAPLVKKLSDETKSLLLKSVRFGERPKNCSKPSSRN